VLNIGRTDEGRGISRARGECAPSGSDSARHIAGFAHSGVPTADIKAVRAKLGASQSEFALMIGVSVATLRNWEQGRRTPDGPALALLRARRRILKPLRTRYMENVERHNRRCTRRRAALARHAVPSRCARSVRVSANPLRRPCDSRHACSGTARS
jgi:DNA-binding XRE family transcriptional regulator